MMPLILAATFLWAIFIPPDSDAKLAAIAAVDPARAEALADCRAAYELLREELLNADNRPTYGPCFRDAVNAGVIAIRWERQ